LVEVVWEVGPAGAFLGPGQLTRNSHLEIMLRTPPLITEIDDGLSNTLLVAEFAGHPKYYVDGAEETRAIPGGNLTVGGAWAASGPGVGIDGSVNKSNRSLFAFHSGGANVLMADGSVDLISDSTDAQTVKSLATRSGGEVAPLDR
jgi:prepilin-type processing-associated H-X9-DG protein